MLWTDRSGPLREPIFKWFEFYIDPDGNSPSLSVSGCEIKKNKLFCWKWISLQKVR